MAELSAEERERLTALDARFSKEDLMRAFDLLSTAEQEIRNASHPRYYFEMVLLRWMHLQKARPVGGSLRAARCERTKPAPRTLNAPTSSKVAPTSNAVAPTSSKVAPTVRRTDKRQIAPTSDRTRVAPTSNRVAPTSGKIAPTSSSKARTDSAI